MLNRCIDFIMICESEICCCVIFINSSIKGCVSDFYLLLLG